MSAHAKDAEDSSAGCADAKPADSNADASPLPASRDAAPEFRADVACEECGTFGVHVFDRHQLCADCCSTRGACCAEREE